MSGVDGLAYVGPVALSTVVTTALAGFAWRRRSEPAATEFAVLMATVTVWSGGYAAGLVTHDPGLRFLWLYVEWATIPFVPMAWLAFALAYAGYGHLLSRPVVAALGVPPAVTVVVAWTNAYHGLLWRTNEVVVEAGVALTVQSFGPWFAVNLVYAYALITVGTALLFKPLVAGDPLYADQVVALAVGAVVPLVANVVSTLGLAPLPGLDLTPYSFAVTGLGFGLAVFRYELLDVVPALEQLGRDVAISDLQDGVLVLDRDRRVRDVNPAAAAMFGSRNADVIGEPVEAALGVDPVDRGAGIDRAREDPSRSTVGERVVFPAPDGRQTLETSVSPVYDQHGRVIAYTLVVRDVTQRETREQRLGVLNRVLRHNVRNDLSVVSVYADHLSERVPEEDREIVETIEQQAAGLVDVAQKARQAEHLMAAADPEGEKIDVERLASAVCERVRSRYPSCTVTLEVSSVTVDVDQSLLEQVLLELVENAVEHNDADRPLVEVSADPDERTAESVLYLCVADNGPGLPDHERVAFDDRAEDPLRHGSGIGLWLAAWGVDRLGGTLSIAEGDPRGTVVTVEVPL